MSLDESRPSPTGTGNESGQLLHTGQLFHTGQLLHTGERLWSESHFRLV